MLKPGEKVAFQAFINHNPNFADRPVNWDEGTDPPDVICTDQEGKRIGVELGEWLNEKQMGASKARERIEDSFDDVVKRVLWESLQNAPISSAFSE